MDCIHCGSPVESGVCTNEACPLSKTNPPATTETNTAV